MVRWPVLLCLFVSVVYGMEESAACRLQTEVKELSQQLDRLSQKHTDEINGQSKTLKDIVENQHAQQKVLAKMGELQSELVKLLEPMQKSLKRLEKNTPETCAPLPSSTPQTLNYNHPYIHMSVAAVYYFVIIPLSKKWAKKQKDKRLRTIGNLIALDRATWGKPFFYCYGCMHRVLKTGQSKFGKSA
jgi:predicted RND superfamily exporter protein